MPKTLDEERLEILRIYPTIPAGNVAVITGTADLAHYSTLALAGTTGETSAVLANLIAGAVSARMNEDHVSDPIPENIRGKYSIAG